MLSSTGPSFSDVRALFLSLGPTFGHSLHICNTSYIFQLSLPGQTCVDCCALSGVPCPLGCAYRKCTKSGEMRSLASASTEMMLVGYICQSAREIYHLKLVGGAGSPPLRPLTRNNRLSNLSCVVGSISRLHDPATDAPFHPRCPLLA